jgi:formate dehydrogenase iron-sulfur subunit
MLAIGKERVTRLKNKGFEEAYLYGDTELEGTHVLYVTKYAPTRYGLPEDPHVNTMVGLFDIVKTLTGVGAAAIVVGLGISFLTGIGYKRHEMHYDEAKHDVVDMDTGKVIYHADTAEELAAKESATSTAGSANVPDSKGKE